MLKSLFIVRHAQSRDVEKGQKDYDRTLTDIGVHDASRLGFYIKKNNLKPGIIYTSFAARAQQTAQLIMEQAGMDSSRLQIRPDLYEASVRMILDLVNRTTEDQSSILLVGHNPAVSHFCEYISKEVTGFIPSGSMVIISFENLGWNQVSKGAGKLIGIINPEDIAVE